MKVKLIFDTENIDQAKELKTVMQASNMSSILFEIIHNLHKKCILQIEIEDNEKLSAIDGIDIVYEKISELIDEHNLIVDEL